MANSWFTLAMQDRSSKLINLINDDIRILITNASYTPNLDADHYVSDITSGAITQRSGTLSGRSFSGRYLMASNITMSLVPAGAADLRVILYKNTGTDSTSTLLCDYDSAGGLPVTPNGGDLVFQFSTQGVCEL